MTTNLDQVKDRVAKLLAVAKDDAASQGEIDNAVRFAKAMMDKHHLSEEDLATEPADQYAQIDAAEMASYRSTIGGRLHAWEESLTFFVSDFVGVKCYLDKIKREARNVSGTAQLDERGELRFGKGIMWYGIEEDTAFAKELYDELRLTIIATCRLKWGNPFRKEGGSYCEGFVFGLINQLRKQASQERREAREKLQHDKAGSALILIERRDDLVKYKNRAADKWLKATHNVNLRAGNSRRGSEYHSNAYQEGKADGQATKVSRKVTPKLN